MAGSYRLCHYLTMKEMKNNRYLLILILLLVVSINGYSSTPGWSVNSADYSNSMNMTAVIKLDHIESTDPNDMVAAFVNGECRGVTSPIFVSSQNRYIAFLLVYSSAASGEEVTFKVYDSSKDQIVDVVNKKAFLLDDIVGSISDPYYFLNTTPESNITSFGFSGVSSVSTIDQNAKTVTVKVSVNADVTNLVADLGLSEGATANVSSVSQQNGVTSNNFTNPVVYQIVSADGTIQNWTVTVQKDASVTSINDPDYFPAKVFPIPAKEQLILKLENLSNASILIFNQQGLKVYNSAQAEDLIAVDVTSFDTGMYLLYIEGQGRKWTKTFIKE